jgi:hypothetical protein
MAQVGDIDRAAALGHKHGVERAQEVRRGIHQGAVEIEDERGLRGYIKLPFRRVGGNIAS